MNAIFDTWPQPLLYLGVLLAVVLLDVFLTIPEKAHPLTFFRVIAERLTAKVFPDPSRPAFQQKIAGALAILVATVPWVIMIFLSVQFTEYPWFFEGLILWLCLGLKPCWSDIKKAELALRKEQKILARDRLNDWVLRRTDNLSAIGIAKACCEALLLRNLYFYQTLILCFILFGAYWTLALRLLLELHLVANGKTTRFRYFAKAIDSTCHILLYIPCKINALTLTIKGGLIKGVAIAFSASKSWPYTNSLWYLSIAAQAINTRLGGPIYYGQVKTQRPHLGEHNPQPNWQTIRHCRFLVIAANSLMLLIIVVTSLFLSLIVKN
ncbi:hypothetical protein C2869_19165 [Saccharobesus litoralis]|uniref:Adenosylcobinamide-phosphate synthase n=1 Tax=Saccharobesus litoralis TaxID=2172099 RepID=A0A2S0VVZ6_9ALTE|nr:cobalamin biosynthesis protein [Saccharobesus litoralis]AWB68394.1 hypothetical protein C2869_19165 [Saccharobesus litoralis]